MIKKKKEKGEEGKKNMARFFYCVVILRSIRINNCTGKGGSDGGGREEGRMRV